MPQPKTTTKDVPAAACRFAATVDVKPTADGKGARVKIFARSNQPVMHWYWGRVVHDMEGERNKPVIPVDYCHRDDEVLGHADKFDADPAKGLSLEADVYPFTEGDRASEVLFRASKGTPYEASINFADADMKVEVLSEGQVATVNGYTFEGPGAIIREWNLRGVAICPYGYDASSQTQFAASSGQTIPVTHFQSSPTMPDPDKNPADAPKTEAEAPKTEPEKKPADDAPKTETEVPKTEPEKKPADDASKLSAPAPGPGQKFLDAFGDAGALWFAQGHSYEEAQTLFAQKTREEVAALRTENENLKTQFKALRGEPAPLSSTDAEPEKGASAAAAKFSATGASDNVAKIAAGIKLPKK